MDFCAYQALFHLEVNFVILECRKALMSSENQFLLKIVYVCLLVVHYDEVLNSLFLSEERTK